MKALFSVLKMELHDLIPNFPLPNDPLFAGKITALREFSELALGVDQGEISEEGLFKSQLFGKRILSPHSTVDGQLVIHSVGTGKTCLAVAVAEAFKHAKIGPGVKRALVVVKGDTVEQSFKDNLTNVCTKGLYTADADRDYTQAGRRSVNARKIADAYEIVHYIELAREIAGLSDEQIIERYSDRVIIFDESHTLRMGFFAPSRERGRQTSRNEDEREMGELRVYERVWHMLHLAVRKKVILLTATPVVDRPEELGLQMNLLLPTDTQLLIPGDREQNPDAIVVNWDDPDPEQLAPYFNTLITYVRNSSSTAMAVEQGSRVVLGDPLQEGATLEVTLQLSVMSELQWMHYKRFLSNQQPSPDEQFDAPEDNAAESEGAQQNAFRRNERHAAMFVFPPAEDEIEQALLELDGQDFANDDAYNDAADQVLDELDLDTRRDAVGSAAFRKRVNVTKNGIYQLKAGSGLPEVLADIAEVERYSCKFATIIALVKERPEELAFIYTEFVTGPGAYLLGLTFEHQGYSRYSGDQAVAADGTIMIGEGRRYAIIAGGVREAYIKNALDLFRHPANRYGAYLQAVIGTNVTREAISFKNVRQVHIANPFWNNTPLEQSAGRATREGAHNDLNPEERHIRIFKHVAVGPANAAGQYNFNTVDVQMYSWSESKNRRNARIMRIAKRTATDCKLNKERNQRPEEVYGSRNCDYQACTYTCIGSEVDAAGNELPPVPTDDTNYFLYYSQRETERNKELIKQLFTVNSQLKLSEIMLAITGSTANSKYVLRALNELVTNHEELNTGFGQVVYLNEHGNVYFTQYEIDQPEQALAHYTELLTVSRNATLADFVTPLQKEEVVVTVEAIEQLRNYTEEELKDTIINANREVKVRLVERALLAENNRTRVQTELLEILANRWYRFTDPFSGSQQVDIFVHDIETRSTDGGKYSSTTKSKKNSHLIRVLKPGTNWRYVTPDEASFYHDAIIAEDIKRIQERFAGVRLYGEISTTDAGVFRLVSPEQPTDKRTRKRGRTCGNIDKGDLIGIIEELGMQPKINRTTSRERMIAVLSEGSYKKVDFSGYSTERIAFIYNWAASTTQDLCRALRAHMEANDLILVN